jgi:hypothetical protein
VTEYRAYIVGGDGKFINFISLVCDDDSAAIAQAQTLLGGLDIELWSGPRLVIRLQHKPE